MIVSVIIVHYQVKRNLFACIASIYTSLPKKSFEIIIVDNDENPSIEYDLLKEFPHIVYIKNAKNTGYSAGNNLGASYARGSYLFFLNPDTFFEGNVIDILTDFLEANKDTAIVAPLLLDEKKRPYPLQGAQELTPKRAVFSLSFLQKLFPKNTIANEYWNKDWDKKTIRDVDVVPGSAFMIRKDFFKKLKGFDEHYFLYFEEHDLCNRVKKIGRKMVMLPKAQVIHTWGESTKNSSLNIKKVFQKSRFYYFRKFYGMPKALAIEIVLRLSKVTIFIFAILCIAGFLRFYKVGEFLPFFGDIAWFYLSAQQMVYTGIIPFIGIASSHPWIHQGAYWTYLLAPALVLGNFSPLSGGYLAGGIGVLTVLILYLCVKQMFSTKIAIFTTAFFATSPLVVISSRMPYHTGPIALFVILYIYSLYKWIQGNSYYFPLSLFFLLVLYNFELATAVFGSVIVIIILFGFYKKKLWLKKIFTLKILLLSLIAILIPLLPMLLYDIFHGFPQTVGFVMWVGYRILVIFGYPQLVPDAIPIRPLGMAHFLIHVAQLFYYLPNAMIAVLLGGISFCVLLFQTYIKKSLSYFLFLLSLFIPLIVVVMSKIPSDAYIPMLFVQLSVCIGITFSVISRSLKQYKWAIYIFFILLIAANSFILISQNFLMDQRGSLEKRVEIAQQIIAKTNGKTYTILGTGPMSEFESFVMPYTYLTWWLGTSSRPNGELKIFVSEDTEGIHIK